MTRFFKTAMFVAVIVLAVASFAVASGKITGVRGLSFVARLTGSPSLNDTKPVYDIGGTDLGIPIAYNNKTYFIFGDTFSGETSYVGGNWRRNTVAWSTDVTPSNGIVFDNWAINPNTGKAKQTFTSNIPSNVVTNIPTGGIVVNGSMYVWFMNVTLWAYAGQWYISQAELARWNDSTTSFDLVSDSTFSGDGNFGMVAAREGVNGDPYIYLWGTPAGRFGKVKLARFLPSQIENRSSYEFYAGTINGVPQWSNDEFVSAFVIDAQIGEMSVIYNEALGAWTIMYFNDINDRVEIRQSDNPWGPWSSQTTVMQTGQCPSGTYGPYAPYMLPQWVDNGGRTLYFTLSLWNPYDVYMMKVTLNMSVPPTGSISINGGAAYTNSTSVALSLPATDDSGTASQMRISNDGVFDTEPWEAYSASKNWAITSGDGTKTVYVRFRDASYNESNTYTDSIVLDTTPPAISLAMAAPILVSEGDRIHVTVNASDASEVASVYADLTTALIQTGGTAWECDVTARGLGAHSIRIDATDILGNTATYYTSGYVTLPVVGITAKSLLDPIMVSASTQYLFRVCGKVSIVNSSTFDLNDGSGVIHVNCPGYGGIADNDYIMATGIADYGSTPTLTVQPDRINRIRP